MARSSVVKVEDVMSVVDVIIVGFLQAAQVYRWVG